MRRLSQFLLLFTAVLAAGCGQKEITPLQRKQGASLASEASFAVTLRDFPRAEGLLVQAVAACPDTPEYWLTLGTVRRRQDNRSGARTAYEQAQKAAKAKFQRDGNNAQALVQQVYALALLDRDDEARKVIERARKDHADNRAIRTFAENNELDRLLADPGFKDLKP